MLEAFFDEDQMEERVVKLTLQADGKRNSAWVIVDTFLGYFRSSEPLDSRQAWTRNPELIARYRTKHQAEQALAQLFEERCLEHA